LALTEVHLGCSVDEQLRWLNEAWQGARAARQDGADVSAVTVWSVFGAYDWDCLVTRAQGRYEPGVFDARDGRPRATPLAGLVKELGRFGCSTEPLLRVPGWWRRPQRLLPQAQAAPQSDANDPGAAA
jgi:dTDP-4-dehydrorhamnose reductase